jgi:hypothetical protein
MFQNGHNPQRPLKQRLSQAKQKGLPNLANPMWWEEVVLIVHFFGFAENQ